MQAMIDWPQNHLVAWGFIALCIMVVATVLCRRYAPSIVKTQNKSPDPMLGTIVLAILAITMALSVMLGILHHH